MKFLLSDEQHELSNAVRDYVVDRCDVGARRQAFDDDTGFNQAFWTGLMDLGVAGIAVPEAMGGLGLGMLDLALAAEALGYAGAPGPFFGHVIAIHALATCGTDAQRETWLPRLISGAAIGTVALSEHFASAGIGCQLVAGRLHGFQRDVLYPNLANVTVVGTEDGFAILSQDAEGQVIKPRETADRTRRLGNVEYTGTPADHMPATVAERRRILDAGLILLAADAFGGASRMLELSVEYAKTRVQFGRLIGTFQGVKHQLANVAVDVEPSRGLYWYAAHTYDRIGADHTTMAALAKAHLADVFMKAAQTSIEAHGGIGYTWEYDAQIWYKRALHDFAYLGTPAVHRERVATLAGW